ncbi:hypothetical protein WICMUC_003942, partial [Wickerhamomyces mucosus]
DDEAPELETPEDECGADDELGLELDELEILFVLEEVEDDVDADKVFEVLAVTPKSELVTVYLLLTANEASYTRLFNVLVKLVTSQFSVSEKLRTIGVVTVAIPVNEVREPDAVDETAELPWDEDLEEL